MAVFQDIPLQKRALLSTLLTSEYLFLKRTTQETPMVNLWCINSGQSFYQCEAIATENVVGAKHAPKEEGTGALLKKMLATLIFFFFLGGGCQYV